MTGILFYLKIYTNTFTMFSDDEEYLTYLENLEITSKKYFSKIHSYCLLPNSCHILIETRKNHLQRFVSPATKKAAKKETGCQYIIVEKNRFSAEISFYIHALAYLTGMESYPAKYPWSSLFYYCSGKKNPAWLETDCILSQISSKYITAYKDYRNKFNSFLLDRSDFLMDKLIEIVADSKIIGSKKFKHIITKTDPDKLPFRYIRKISADKISELVEQKLEYGKHDKRIAKIYLTYLYSGITNRLSGKFFGGISPSRITHIVRQTRIRMKKDEKFKSLIDNIEDRLKTAKK